MKDRTATKPERQRHTSYSRQSVFLLFLFSLALLVAVPKTITLPKVTSKNASSPPSRKDPGQRTPDSADQNSCNEFDQGDAAPASDVSSIFNCGSAHGKCMWHYPARFFDRTCGVGREHGHLLDEAKTRLRKNELWGGMVPILLPSVSLNPSVQRTDARSAPFPRHNLTLVHVHKTGGTSLVVALNKLGERGARTAWHCAHSPAERGANATFLRAEATAFLQGAVKYRNMWEADQHTIFAVVRDPAERFISAIGQATGGRGTRRDGVAQRLREECLKGTSRDTLRCFVDLVERKGAWIELHFARQVVELSFATLFEDVPIAVFPFGALPSLLEELDADPADQRKGSRRAGGESRNLTVSDYDDDVLRRLCAVYAADALLLRHLGHGSRCDGLL